MPCMPPSWRIASCSVLCRGFGDIHEKVGDGQRISDAEALRLFESKGRNALGAIADLARQRKTGNRASFIINCYINYSNYCILSCQFCAFARKKRDADGFQFTVEEIVQKAKGALHLGITELHIVGGLHPSLPFSYYTDMLKSLRALDGPRAGTAPSRNESIRGSDPTPASQEQLSALRAGTARAPRPASSAGPPAP